MHHDLCAHGCDRPRQARHSILNAGIVKLDFEIVENTGHEAALQVNYLSTVLPSILILPLIKTKSSRATLACFGPASIGVETQAASGLPPLVSTFSTSREQVSMPSLSTWCTAAPNPRSRLPSTYRINGLAKSGNASVGASHSARYTVSNDLWQRSMSSSSDLFPAIAPSFSSCLLAARYS
jgi:hypothetical protein